MSDNSVQTGFVDERITETEKVKFDI